MNPTSTTRSDTPTLRDELIEELIAIRAASGAIPNYMIDAAAARLELHTGSVRRLVAKRCPAPTPDSIVVTDDMVVDLIRAGGNLMVYVEQLHPDEEGRWAFYQRLRRAFINQIDPLELAVHAGDAGMKGWRLVKPYNRFASQRRNERWQIDVQTLDTYCVPHRGKSPVKPYIIMGIDEHTRMVVMWEIVAFPKTYDGSISAVGGSQIASALLNAMVRYGVPEQIYMDNGTEFTSNAAINVAARCGTTLTPVTRYRGEEKGYIERAFRTMQARLVADDPARTNGAKSSLRYTIDGFDLTKARPIDTFRADAGKVIANYHRRPHTGVPDHSTRNRFHTPAELWDASTEPLFYPDRDQIRAVVRYTTPVHVWGALAQPVVSNEGVRVARHNYTAIGNIDDERTQILQAGRRDPRVLVYGIGYDPARPEVPDEVVVANRQGQALYFARRHADIDEVEAIKASARHEQALANAEQRTARAHQANRDAAAHRAKSDPTRP